MTPRRAAFSLVELLVVIAMIALIASFTVPAVGTMMRGNEVTRAQQIVEQQLISARQTAVARNRRVEVRFLKFDNPDAIGSEPAFCALQTFLLDENNNATATGRVAKLPPTIVMNDAGATTSSLLANTGAGNASTPIPGVGAIPGSNTRVFQFRPDGSTNLAPTGNWFVTLHEGRAGANAATPPPNFVTIQVDPVSGAVRSYRP